MYVVRKSMASTTVRGQLIFQDENALVARGKSNVSYISLFLSASFLWYICHIVTESLIDRTEKKI